MNKKELVELVAEKTGATKKDVTEAMNVALDAIAAELKAGNVVDLSGFGKFVVKEKAARTGVNPATGKKIEIAASKAPGFKAAKALKEAVK